MIFRSFNVSVVISLLLLSGCAHLMMSDNDIIKNIDQDVRNKNYSDAISAIDSLPSSYQKKNIFIRKKNEINKKLNIYENNVISRVKDFERKSDWKSAGEIYQKALDRVPVGSPVLKAYKRFELMQRQQLEKAQLESYIIYARYLIDAIKLRQDVENKLFITEIDGLSLSEATDEARELSMDIHDIGKRALAKQDYTTAIKAIYMAKRLNPRNAKILASMNRLNKRSDEIDRYVETLKKHAASSYGSDAYKIALKLWQEVLMYVPDDKVVLANIERVNRVLNSLQQIERKQQ